jgi:hypothetical protein
MAKKPKEYRIESFEDLCNTLTAENKDRLLKDFASAFSKYTDTIGSVRKFYHKDVKTLKNWEIAQFTFIWIDDGANDCKGVHIETPDMTIKAKFK